MLFGFLKIRRKKTEGRCREGERPQARSDAPSPKRAARDENLSPRWGESGNVFFTLFGAVALVGVVGVATSTLMRGPVGTVVKLNQAAKADAQMQIAQKLAMLQAAKEADSGDCDADGYVEPIGADTAATCAPSPAGGGCIPSTIGSSKNDPWGTNFGYCSWDHGNTVGSGCGTAGANNLDGTTPPDASNNTVIAIISAGPNRLFETSCGAHPTYVSKPSGSDDMVLDITYGGAIEASGGLWSLKSGDPDTAYIDKNTEITGDSTVAGAVDFQSGGSLSGGAFGLQNTSLSFGDNSMLDLPDQNTLGSTGASTVAGGSTLPEACTGNPSNDGALRINHAGGTAMVLEICDQLSTPGWTEVGGSGSTAGAQGALGNVQLSDGAGGFAADADFSYTSATDLLSVPNISTTTDVTVGGDLIVNGSDADINADMDVSGAFTGTTGDFSSTLDAGATTVTSLDAGSGLITTTGTINAGTAATLGATTTTTLGATGAVDFDLTLNVDGETTLRGDVNSGDGDALTINDVEGVDITAGDLTVTNNAIASAFRLSGDGDANDEGLYYSSNGEGLALRVENMTALEIDEMGDVGIGLGSFPTAKLDVGGEIRLRSVGYLAGSTCNGLHGALTYSSGDEYLVCSSITNNWETIGTSGGGGFGATSPWDEFSDYIARENSTFIVNEGSDLSFVSSVLEGPGTRMLWYPSAGSLRAGTVTGTQWDETSTGQNSTAFGLDTIASGDASFAAGDGAQATTQGTVALGTDVEARATQSIALGNEAVVAAGATNSMAIGLGNASGAAPQVQGANSLGVFMGDQTGMAAFNATNTIGIFGGDVVLSSGAAAGGTSASGALLLDVEGKVGAHNFCDSEDAYCFTAEEVATGSVGVPGADTEVLFNSGGSLGSDVDFVYYQSTNQMGLGTGTPLYNLDIHGINSAQIGLSNDGASGSSTAGLRLFTERTDTTKWLGEDATNQGWFMTAHDHNYTAIPEEQNALKFTFWNGATYSNTIVFTSTGRIGMDNSTPAAQIELTEQLLLGNINDCTASTQGALRLNASGDVLEMCDFAGSGGYIAIGGAAVSAPGADRQVIFNSGGSLSATTNFVFDNAGRLGVGLPNPDDELDIVGTAEITGNTVLGAALDVTGQVTFNSGLDVANAVTMGNTLDVTGAATLNDTLDVTGATTLNNTLTVTDQVTFNSGMTAAQDSVFAARVGIQDATPDGTLILDVEGDVGAVTYCDEDGNYCFDAQDVSEGVAPGADTEIILNSGGVFYASSAFTYDHADGTFTVSNANDLVFTSGGYLGIGTSTPSRALTIGSAMYMSDAGNISSGADILFDGQGAIAAQDVLWLNMDADNTGTSAEVVFAIGGESNAATGSSRLMTLTSAGSLRIGGSATAETKLDVDGTIKMAYGGEACDLNREGAIHFDSAGDNFYVCQNNLNGWQRIVTTGGAGNDLPAAGVNREIMYNSGGILYGSSGLVFGSAGGIGIGTATPSGALHLAGDNVNLLLDGSGAVGSPITTIEMVRGGVSYQLRAGIGASDNFDIYDPSAAASRFYINGAGLTGFGTTSPQAFIDFASSGAIKMTAGTTLERPGVPSGTTAVDGMFRFNTDTNQFEGYNGTDWNGFMTGAAGSDRQVLFNSGGAVTGDANLVFDAANNVNIGAGNFFFTSTGELGIGTTTISTGAQTLELDVEGDIGGINYCDNLGNDCFTAADVAVLAGGGSPAPGLDTQIIMNSGGLFYASAGLTFDHNDGTFLTYNDFGGITLSSAGNFGVGTLSPLGTAHIAATYPTLTMQDTNHPVTDNNFRGEIAFIDDVGAQAGGIGFDSPSDNNMRLGTTIDTHLIFATNNTEQMILTSTGRLGVGTTAPDTRLDVDGTIKMAYGGEACDLSREGAIHFDSASDNFFVCQATANGWQRIVTTGGSGGDLPAAGNNREIMYNSGGVLYGSSGLVFGSAGEIGIGTATPSTLLYVSGSSADNEYLVTIENTGTDGEFLRAVNSNGNEAIRLQQSTGGAGQLFLLNPEIADSAFLALENSNAATTGGPRLRLDHRGTGGRSFDIISTGTGNGPGAGFLEIYDQTATTTRWTMSPDGIVRFHSTGAVVMNNGTTAERPINVADGMFRFNTDTAQFEGYNGTDWNGFMTGSPGGVGGDRQIIFNSGGALTADPSFVISSLGFVGIGNTTPVSNLDLHTDDFSGLALSTDGSAANSAAQLQLFTERNDTTKYLGEDGTNQGWYMTAHDHAHSTLQRQNSLGFVFWNGSTWQDSLYMTSTGRVGLGTDTPSIGGEQDLLFDVDGATGSQFFCNEDGNDCFTASQVSVLAGGGSPAPGLDTQIVLNSGGLFYASAGLTFDHTDGEFNIGGTQGLYFTSSGDLIVGSYQTDDTGTGNEDSRMFFDVSTGAFRAGGVDGNQWNFASAGQYSTAFGENTVASGSYSFAATSDSSATGDYSVAMGQGTASGPISFAVGQTANASNFGSVAIGAGANSSGNQALALFGIASAQSSVAIGGGNATNDFSMAFGSFTSSGGYASTAIGYDATAQGDYSMALGLGNETGAGEIPLVSGDSSFGIFMGDHSDVVLSSANTFGVFGGRMVIDPTVPATVLAAQTGLDVDAAIRISVDGEVCNGNPAMEGAIKFDAGTFYFCADNASDWESITLGSGTLGALSDTNINTPADGEVLYYSGGGWVNNALAIRDLADANTDYTSGNMYLGQGTPYLTATGSDNLAIGFGAMGSLSTDMGQSLAVGAHAAEDFDGTVGSITAVGAYALQNVTTGERNVGIGRKAGVGITVGGQNTFVGEATAEFAPNGADNTGIGQGAMFQAGGDRNTAIGRGALYGGAVGVPSQHNTALGYSAGSNINGGANNLFLGYQAGNLTTSGNDNIIIGYDVDAPTATTSNYLNIGDALYGAMNTGTYFVSGTGGLNLPAGIDGERPDMTGLGGGMIRFSSTSLGFEGYDGTTWSPLGSGAAGSISFISLADTPATYTAQGGRFARVNSAETAIEFTDEIIETVTGEPVPTAMVLDDLGDVIVGGAGSGECLKFDGSDWVAGSCADVSGTAAAGSTSEIQLNSGGVLYASSNFVFTSAGYFGLGLNDPFGTFHIKQLDDSESGGIILEESGGSATGRIYQDTAYLHLERPSRGEIRVGDEIDFLYNDVLNVTFERDGLVRFTSTGAIVLPSGDTSARPVAAEDGMLRYNSATGKFEGYQAGTWEDIITGSVALGAVEFLSLSDTPASYSGQAGRFTRVNAGETAIEFTDQIIESITGQPAPTGMAINDLSDVNTAPTGGQFLQYDSASGEWIAAAVPTGAGGLWFQSSDDIYYNSGFVGIGTNNPQSVLHINDSWDGFTSTILANTDSGASALAEFTAVSDAGIFSMGVHSNAYAYENGAAYVWHQGDKPLYFGTDDTERMRITASGNFGFGTTSPQAFVEFASSGAIILPSGDSAERPASIVDGMLRYNSALNTFEGVESGAWVDLTGGGGSGSGAGLWQDSGSGYIEYSNALGGIKLGTTSGGDTPVSNFVDALNDLSDVNASPSGGQFLQYDSASGEWIAADIGTSGGVWSIGTGDDIYYNSGTPQVGIGTAIPQAALHIVGDNQDARITSYSTSSGNGGDIDFRRSRGSEVSPYTAVNDGDKIGSIRFWGSTNVDWTEAAQIEVIAANGGNWVTGTNRKADMVFRTLGGFGDYDERMRIEAEGLIRFTSTGAIVLPSGVTAERPTNAENGMLRYNSATGKFEGYQAGTWEDIVTGSISLGAIEFLSLADTPASYGGQAGRFARVNSGETALEFTDQIIESVTGADAPNTIDLNDLGDVNTTPTDGQFLTYDSASGTWVAAAIPSGQGGKWLDGVGTDEIYYSSAFVGIGINDPLVQLDVTGTGAIAIPAGTDGERPTSVRGGMIRFNSTSLAFEGYDGTAWEVLGSDAGGSISFTSLADTPGNYTGQAGRFVRVNSGENAVEFTDQIVESVAGDAPVGMTLNDLANVNASPSNGQVLTYNSATGTWIAAAGGSGGGSGDGGLWTDSGNGYIEYSDIYGGARIASVPGNAPVRGLASGSGSVASLNDIGDVSVASPNSDDVLSWNGSAWVATAGGSAGLWTAGSGDSIYYNSGSPRIGVGTTSPAVEVDVVGDIQLTGSLQLGMIAGDAPTYVSSANLISLSQLSDTDFSAGIADGAALVYNSASGEWEAGAAASADTLSGLSCSSGEVAEWNGSAWVCSDSAGGVWEDSGSGYIQYTSTLGGMKVASVTGAPLPSTGALGGAGGSDTLSGLSCSNGEVAQWNGSAWVCSSSAGGVWSDSGNGYIEYSSTLGGIKVAGISGVSAPTGAVSTSTLTNSVSLNALSDVDLGAGIGDDECLKYSSASGEWASGTCGSGDTGIWTDSGSGYIEYASTLGGIKVAGVAGAALPSSGAVGAAVGGGGSSVWTEGSGSDIYFSSGYVGINETSPDVALDVLGDIEYTGTLTDVSDMRLKTDITPLNTNEVIGKLSQINTYSFRMKDTPDAGIEFGVMAQELEKVFPELVKTADDEMGTKSVNYVGLIAPLVEASKELKSENDALRAELADMKLAQAQFEADIMKEVKGLKAHTGYGIDKAQIGLWMIAIIIGLSSVFFMVGGILRHRQRKQD